MIKHNVSVSQLNGVDGGRALVQVSHREIWAPAGPENTVPEAELILVTGHGQFYNRKGFKNREHKDKSPVNIIVTKIH